MPSNSIPVVNREASGAPERLRSILPPRIRYLLQAATVLKQRACHRPPLQPPTDRRPPFAAMRRLREMPRIMQSAWEPPDEPPASSPSTPPSAGRPRRRPSGATPYWVPRANPRAKRLRPDVVAENRRRTGAKRRRDATARGQVSTTIRGSGSISVPCRPGPTPTSRRSSCAPDAAVRAPNRCANGSAFSCRCARGHMIQHKESDRRRASRRGRTARRAGSLRERSWT